MFRIKDQIMRNPRKFLLAASIVLIAAKTFVLVIEEDANFADAETNEALVFENKIFVTPKPGFPFYDVGVGDTVLVSFKNASGTYQRVNMTSAGFRQVSLEPLQGAAGGSPGASDCNSLQ